MIVDFTIMHEKIMLYKKWVLSVLSLKTLFYMIFYKVSGSL